MTIITSNAIKVEQGNRAFYLIKMRARDIADISYVSIRGKDDEVGAVQRMLNTKRISGIKSFIMNDGDLPATIIMNWVSEQVLFYDDTNNTLRIPKVDRAAQLIDGQHRVAGLKEAINENPDIGELEIPVSIYDGLDTNDCANIFLSINTEQKPVPKSLVYDLYQLATEHMADPAVNRARDIVDYLNDEQSSPYYQQIKKPGTPRRKGGILLSTAVSALKPLVETKGDFELIGIYSFEDQKNIIFNFFNVIMDAYGSEWLDPKNAFLYASGFTGAIDFFKSKLMHYCDNSGKDFRKENMSLVIDFDRIGLIYQEQVKGLQGKGASRHIMELLVEAYATNNVVGVVKT
ncbi:MULTISPECIES: DGQHR domain-containing protein [Aeromonas]|uniref:DGQHR domain-containing protein n=1 Tax=Aeromonas TaxID=642 RepID=UPI0025B6E1CB|nr:DGQHR domain-containing protein [Aeromonas caviae]MDX7734423.1 DGQHR domain-containing protein [Aeromonas caviae]